mgnify:FL=1
MAFQYDINKIFAELEQQVQRKKKQLEETDENKENNPIESPEDAPETQEVAPATSKATEDTHGGDEASKEIEKSPNSVDDGKNPDKENKSEKTKNTGKQGQGEGHGNEEKEKSDKDDVREGEKVGSKNKSDVENADIKKQKSDIEKQGENYFITTDAKNPSKNKPKTTPEDLQKAIEELFEKNKKKQEEFRTKNREEYLKRYILEIIKKISAQHAGIDKQDGSETYDKKQMLQHMLKHQNYKLLGDKYDLKDARYVQFFIDTSGVYGCGSNKIMHELMPEVIGILEKQGYECYIAACGNGFYQRDMAEDEYYGTRKTLEGYNTGKVNKIACPTPQTAAKMANEAEFSIILADFDGLSSICEMANLCQKDKVPYFLCTEDRYPWEDPTLHDWVNPDLCDYNYEFVYDVSMDGNPTLEQYEEMQYDDYYEQDEEYEQSDSYEYDD